MPSRSDCQVLYLIEEAAVLREAAERDFESISEEVQKTVRESRRLSEETLLQQERARQRLFDTRVRLSDQLQRRDPKSVTACYCKGRLWVCQRHPAVALDECRCGAAAVPCSCNPNRTPPLGYERIGGASQSWSSPRAIRWRSLGWDDEAHWHSTSDPIWPRDGEQILVRQQYEPGLKRLIFRATPIARWESMDGIYIYSFRFFAQWRVPDARSAIDRRRAPGGA
jgi:hypothetical protein